MPEPTPEEKAAEEAAAAKAAEERAASEEAAKKAAEDDVYDKDRAMALITKLRDEVKAAKADSKKAADLETKLKEYEDAQLSEKEKLEKKLADVEAERSRELEERQSLVLRLAVHSWKPREGKPGLGDADLALVALDRSKLEYDDRGEPSNLDDVLGDLLEQKPILRGTPGKVEPGGKLNSGDGQQGGEKPALTADELDWAQKTGMSVEEYAAYKGGNSMKLEDAHRARENLAAATKQ